MEFTCEKTEEKIKDYITFKQKVMCTVAHRILTYDKLHSLNRDLEKYTKEENEERKRETKRKIEEQQNLCIKADDELEDMRKEILKRENQIGNIDKTSSPDFKDFKKAKKEIHRAFKKVNIEAA